MPAQNNENRSPVYHELNYLGLESWCVEPLYCYVYRRLLDFRQNRRRCAEPRTVARWLLGALLINPNVIMLWNMRRELAQSYRLDPCEELLLTRLVLYHKPNSYEAFAYRRWLMPQVLDIKQVDSSRPYDPTPADSPLCTEVQLVESCADRYASNYHAWSYRRYLLTLRKSRGLTHPSLESEWRNTLAWCQRHVSDNSGHSYRQFLLRRCVLESATATTSTSSSSSSDVAGNQPNGEHDLDACDREERLLAYMDTGAVDGLRKKFLVCLRESMRRLERNAYEDKLQRYLRALSYWAEECYINERLISTFEHNEVLWGHRRFLAQTLIRLTAMYVRHGRYVEDELVDARHRDEPVVSFVRDNGARDDPVIAAHVLLLEAFRVANDKLAQVARERDPHEKVFVDRFFSFVAALGFDTVT